MNFFQRLRSKSKRCEKKQLLTNDSLAKEIELKEVPNDNYDTPFPNEILFIILLYLNIKTVGTLRTVSKQFNAVSQNAVLLYAQFCRDFPSVWPAQRNISDEYKAFYRSMRNPGLKKQFDTPACSLLRMHGNDIGSWVKPKKLTIHTLLIHINNRPLIRLFSRHQEQLNLIYEWLKSNKFDLQLKPAYLLRLSVLCNQYQEFEHHFAEVIQTTSQSDIEKLMYLAILLGYGQIIRSLYALQPTIDLNNLIDGLTYSQIALIEGNGQALDALLSLGAPVPQYTQQGMLIEGGEALEKPLTKEAYIQQNNQVCNDIAMKRNNKTSLDVLPKMEVVYPSRSKIAPISP